VNFDGATKGNLGPAGYGGIFRNAEGSVLNIYHGSLAETPTTLPRWKGYGKVYA